MNSFEIKQGWVQGVKHAPSPHFDTRPEQQAISLLVIHNISLPPGEFGGPYIEDLFLGRLDCTAHPFFEQLDGLRVSAHCLIRRDGSLVQFVDFNHRAWHAGVSCFDGIERCNDFSIGIELEGTDTQDYSEAQYTCLHALTTSILKAYPEINPERITGHEHIAPGRKTDPGPAFDWEKYKARLEADL